MRAGPTAGSARRLKLDASGIAAGQKVVQNALELQNAVDQ